MKRQSRTKAVMAILVALVFMGGCNWTNREQIELMKSTIDIIQEQSDSVEIMVISVRNSVDQMKLELNDPALKEEERAKILKLIDDGMKKVDAGLVAKAQLDQRIAAWEAKIDEKLAQPSLNLGDTLEVVGQGVAEASHLLPPPYGTILNLIGIGLIGIGGVTANGYRRKLKIERAVSTDLVGSMEKALEASNVKAESTRADLEDVLAKRMASTTKARVRAIKKHGI